MGATDLAQFNQLKKGQGETNERLDNVEARLAEILVELKRTNELLGWVCNAMHERAKAE